MLISLCCLGVPKEVGGGAVHPGCSFRKAFGVGPQSQRHPAASRRTSSLLKKNAVLAAAPRGAGKSE